MDFYTLILYPATLLYLFIVSNRGFFFFGGVFRVFCHLQIMSFAKSETFNSSFPICMPFITSLSCLVALTRTFSTMWNKSGETAQPCFVPDLRREAFGFPQLGMILVLYGLYYVEVLSFYTHFIKCFNHEWMFYLVKRIKQDAFSASIDKII